MSSTINATVDPTKSDNAPMFVYKVIRGIESIDHVY